MLVAKETVRVNRAVAHFTDEVYQLPAILLAGGFAAPYEPAALRAQAYAARLAYRQSIQTYIYTWKQLVIDNGRAAIAALRSRRPRRFDDPLLRLRHVLAYVLRNHTDVLTAQYGLEGARYNLKLAQVTSVPDVGVDVVARDPASLRTRPARP